MSTFFIYQDKELENNEVITQSAEENTEEYVKRDAPLIDYSRLLTKIPQNSHDLSQTTGLITISSMKQTDTLGFLRNSFSILMILAIGYIIKKNYYQ